jgi:hypothetical protein
MFEPWQNNSKKDEQLAAEKKLLQDGFQECDECE